MARTERDEPDARLWIKIDLGARGQIGPGKIALLKAVASEGSISGAARAMGMSYRRAWLLIDALNKTCGQPVVDTRIGGPDRGGAAITALGRELVAIFDGVHAQAQQAAGSRLRELLGLMPAPEGEGPSDGAQSAAVEKP